MTYPQNKAIRFEQLEHGNYNINSQYEWNQTKLIHSNIEILCKLMIKQSTFLPHDHNMLGLKRKNGETCLEHGIEKLQCYNV